MRRVRRGLLAGCAQLCRSGTARHTTTRHDPARHNTTQHSTPHRNTSQHITSLAHATCGLTLHVPAAGWSPACGRAGMRTADIPHHGIGGGAGGRRHEPPSPLWARSTHDVVRSAPVISRHGLCSEARAAAVRGMAARPCMSSATCGAPARRRPAQGDRRVMCCGSGGRALGITPPRPPTAAATYVWG